MECIVIAGIIKNATMKGLITFDFGSFVKSKDLTHIPLARPGMKRMEKMTAKVKQETLYFTLYLISKIGKPIF
jgi:hypothetical protein